MSDTSIPIALPSGWTVYLLEANEADEVWNGTAYVPLVPGDLSAYAIAAPETGGTGVYTAQFPTASPSGRYTHTFRRQLGANPASTDPLVSLPIPFYTWDGTDLTEGGEGGGGTTPVPTATDTGIAPALNGLAAVYCTDENIALRAWGDYTAICPPSQKLAAGTDGVILSANRWELTSATVDFGTAGVAPGCVVWLKLTNAFSSNGEIFAVNSVTGSTVTLRRMGQNAAVGQPPAPAAGLTGITFSVLTFAPQIDVASYDANHFFGIDVISPTKSPARLYDQRELQSYVVLMVLKRAYAISLKVKAEDYALKLEQVSEELNDLTGRLTIRWGADGKSQPATSPFSTRVRR